jgi:hypothetical protein
MVLKVGGLRKIVGIVSAAVAKPVIFNQREIKIICDLDNYLVYTDVAKFYDWINQVILETGVYPNILQSTSTYIPTTTSTEKSFIDDRLYFVKR